MSIRNRHRAVCAGVNLGRTCYQCGATHHREGVARGRRNHDGVGQPAIISASFSDDDRGRAIDEAFVESFRWVMLIGAILAALASITAMFTIGNPPKPEPALCPQAA